MTHWLFHIRTHLCAPLRAYLRVSALALVLMTAGWAAQAGGLVEGFVTGTEDLPLMEGLAMAPDATVFDTPQGRIVEAFAVGDLKPETVRRFYQATLPQLGWQASGDGYQREGETLNLDITESQGGVTVRFTISPTGS